MRLATFFFSLLLAAGAAAQQPNTVTANVSVTSPLTAGTATFRVQFLDANLTSNTDSALTVLANAGINASHLTGVSVTLNQGFVISQYDFALPVPAAEYTATRDRIIAAQRAIANVQSQAISWSTSYSATSDDTAKALEQALPGLLERAKVQAEMLAASLGRTLGPVQSLTPNVSTAGLSATVSLSVQYVVTAPQ